MHTHANLVLIRHGHSEWNLCGRFTGWSDITLTHIGLEEARAAGQLLQQHGYVFDEAHISVLKRTQQTLDALLAGAGHAPLPVYSHWRLNERHYGQLQGMVKEDIFAEWGTENARHWWRGYQYRPPELNPDDTRHPRFDPLYQHLAPHELPAGESLHDCLQRLLPCWQNVLQPALQQGRNLVVVSHGNTMRALVMWLEQLNAEQVESVEIPSAEPLIYRFDPAMNIINKVWLKPETRGL